MPPMKAGKIQGRMYIPETGWPEPELHGLNKNNYQSGFLSRKNSKSPADEFFNHPASVPPAHRILRDAARYWLWIPAIVQVRVCHESRLRSNQHFPARQRG